MNWKFKIGKLTIIITELTSWILAICIGIAWYKEKITMGEGIVSIFLLSISESLKLMSKEEE